MLVTSLSQADPKLLFTTPLADGRVGWDSASPLPRLQFGKRPFCLWRGRADSSRSAFWESNLAADVRSGVVRTHDK